MGTVRVWRREDAARFVRVPTASDDKYSRGVVGLRTGSSAYPGAAVLGVEAAWRAGAGFVRFSGAPQLAALVLARRPETVVAEGLSARAGAWVIGSGTDAAERTLQEEAALRALLAGRTPVVVDAGALDLAARASAPVIATPHAGEFARLRESLGLAEVGSDRAAALRETASALGHTLLLKGAPTLVASAHSDVIEVPDAPAWLATAGTGDVLAGLIGTLLAANPGADPAEIAATGAWLHGEAARIAAGMEAGSRGHPIVALDVAEALPRAIGALII